jgi:hypothetical protein
MLNKKNAEVQEFRSSGVQEFRRNSELLSIFNTAAGGRVGIGKLMTILLLGQAYRTHLGSLRTG